MTNTLRERALGALSVLRLTSHSDKAEILSAYQPHWIGATDEQALTIYVENLN